MLSARRFPDTITRRRQGPGGFNQYGEFEPGAVQETEFKASIQPLKLEDLDTTGGARVSHRLKVYIPEPGALAAAFGDAEADQVLVDGLEYVVEESKTWRGSHTRAVLLRET